MTKRERLCLRVLLFCNSLKPEFGKTARRERLRVLLFCNSLKHDNGALSNEKV